MSHKDIKGTWAKTARDIKYKDGVISCHLKRKNGSWLENKVKCDHTKEYNNYDGVLNTNSEPKPKVAILLTMCFRGNPDKKIYYEKSIKEWNKENLPIFIVESSNYNFKKFDNMNLKICSLDIVKEPSFTQYESKSILYAMNFFKEELKSYTHVLKITGRYFLNIKNILDNLPNVDLLLQHRQDKKIKWNNSEIFGFRIGMENELLSSITKKGTFEHHIYKISKNIHFLDYPLLITFLK